MYNKVCAIGTIRVNWFTQPSFLCDKLLRQLGRGASFEITTDHNNCNIGLLKWYDNKSVHFDLNFVTSGEVAIIRQWSKKRKKVCLNRKT